MSRHGNDWRWDVFKHYRPTTVTVAVLESPDSEAARRKRLEDEHEMVPFGFARALDGLDLDPPRPRALDRMDVLDPPEFAPAHDARCPEICCGHVPAAPEMPLLWDGDQA